MVTLFFIAAAVAIIATFMVITHLEAVHALLHLVVSLLAVALIFYLLGAPFIAVLEVIIYAGAIMVLFVFVVMVLNLMIGLLTPPVGMVLYVLSKVAKVPFERCVTATAPFIVPLVIVLLLLTFIPELSMWLPNLLYRN